MISKEREKYHELMSGFIPMLRKGALVYDIGVSSTHNYSHLFQDFHFMTIDRDSKKNPDICLDIEKLTSLYDFEDYLDIADAILCNGVIEQCSDPFNMLRACNSMLKSSGLALFGFVLLGFPEYDNDRFRFTKRGARESLGACGFGIRHEFIVTHEGKETYIYLVAQKI